MTMRVYKMYFYLFHPHQISFSIILFANHSVITIYCVKSSSIGTDFGSLNHVFHFQVHDTGYNDNINLCQIRFLCQRHAYGRTVGKKSCVHILFGAYSWLVALIYVSVLFPRNICVSTLFHSPFTHEACVEIYGIQHAMLCQFGHSCVYTHVYLSIYACFHSYV